MTSSVCSWHHKLHRPVLYRWADMPNKQIYSQLEDSLQNWVTICCFCPSSCNNLLIWVTMSEKLLSKTSSSEFSQQPEKTQQSGYFPKKKNTGKFKRKKGQHLWQKVWIYEEKKRTFMWKKPANFYENNW